ncbi:MAG: hypothetical protein M1828_003520 [Chrysothrix sp. TS-e1954]|nr:MAG: hypothetical protein M1828_003520 [Chrysothrix sp. TS-e1954]
MPPGRKRRAPTEVEPDGDDTPVPPRTQRRGSTSSSASATGSEDEGAGSSANQQQMIKSLVRLALACEHARLPIRRGDISSKVLGTSSRQFKRVFEGAQLALRQTFGMEMVELPAKEKVTISQKRAAQRSQQTQSQASTSSKVWVLSSSLPAKYRDAAVLEPSKVPTSEAEAAYTGLYSFLIAVITLGGGQLSEAKLDRYLRRMNADQSTPIDKTEKMLARMVKEGYLHKSKETVNGEEMTEYFVGPRGKIEVGEKGVAGLVRRVYGLPLDGAPGDTDLERRLERTLRISASLGTHTQSVANGSSITT